MRRLLRKIILAIAANSLAVWAALEVFPQYFTIVSTPAWQGIILVGISIGLLNTFIKPILKLLSLPFVILTMGLFLIVINALILWMIEWLFSGALASLGVQLSVIGGFFSYLLIGFTLGVLNTFLHWILKK